MSIQYYKFLCNIDQIYLQASPASQARQPSQASSLRRPLVFWRSSDVPRPIGNLLPPLNNQEQQNRSNETHNSILGWFYTTWVLAPKKEPIVY